MNKTSDFRDERKGKVGQGKVRNEKSDHVAKRMPYG